ncbi:MAG TPA: redoxin domain-containing protein [Arachidicoccus sp.]|nr:redoxin domain-containing protein [Arachidicoccus sp.]
MKKILCLLGGAMLVINGIGQGVTPLPLYIDGRLPNLTFPKVINYKANTATMDDFQGKQKKVVIFDFWNTHCAVCIAQFPKEIELQKKYAQELQFVMVTKESKEKVEAFIAKWSNIHHLKLNIPIIVEDTLLMKKYIRVLYEPQYAWIDHHNRMIAQTSDYFINEEHVKSILKLIASKKSRGKIRSKNESILQNN